VIDLAATAIIVLAAPLNAQALFLLAEVIASLRAPRPGRTACDGCRPAVAVVVPAHNESTCVAKTISLILPQLAAADRVLVVADNCSDATASIAASAGAEVIERHDLERVGKGYALDYAIQHIGRGRLPEVVIFVDADCEVTSGSIETLARLVAAHGRPVQAANLMQAPASAPLTTRIAQFAFKVKNYVRPLGSKRLGCCCHLTGTGMAFPWPIVRSMDLATGHIAEDVKFGADLAISGHEPLFCAQAKVISSFPTSIQGQRLQKTRWEHGHLALIRQYVPRLFLSAFKNRRIGLLAMALDLSIPPLSLFALLMAALSGAAVLAKLGGSSTDPIIACGLMLTLSSSAVWLAWYRHGREIISARELLVIPLYALSIIPRLWRFLIRGPMAWVRAERDQD
jgi:glycosyltransferase involved in cell wall biosynthesis